MDLQQFCSTRAAAHFHIDQPFSLGDWTYATNGHICIRVPRVAEITNELGPEKIEKMFNDAEFSRGVTVWQALPPFELKTLNCTYCRGTGYMKQCPAFTDSSLKCSDGDGAECVGFDENCMTHCDSTTKGAEPCDDCDGTGKVKLIGKTIVQGSVSETQISNIYLDMIRGLPGIMIAPYDEKSYFRLKWDGGEGLLMPVDMNGSE